jgi:hypothetical protein
VELIQVQRVRRRSVRAIVILRPEIEDWAAYGGRGRAIHIAGEQPIADIESQALRWHETKLPAGLGIRPSNWARIRAISSKPIGKDPTNQEISRVLR